MAPGLLEQSADWLAQQRDQFLSSPVTYSRGNDSVVLNATKGQTPFEQVDEHGVVTTMRSQDFLIRASDLVLTGNQVTPEAGDKITETVGNVTSVYEVMSMQGGPPWRYSDPHEKTIRVHT
ncbi:MAG: hypothetical protein D6744_11170, partial [Planctomycetota bacterium]